MNKLGPLNPESMQNVHLDIINAVNNIDNYEKYMLELRNKRRKESETSQELGKRHPGAFLQSLSRFCEDGCSKTG